MRLKHNSILLVFVVFALAFTKQDSSPLPEGFVYVKTIIPDLDVELRYFTTNNFVGDTIDGYKSNKLILTAQAAHALKLVHDELQMQNLCLKVYMY